MAPALTARKFGITPKIRLGCCLEGATDLLAVSAAVAAELTEVGDSVFGADAPSAAGDCGCAVAEESGSGGVVCWAESEETKIVTRQQTTILTENLIDKCPPVLMRFTSSEETVFQFYQPRTVPRRGVPLLQSFTKRWLQGAE